MIHWVAVPLTTLMQVKRANYCGSELETILCYYIHGDADILPDLVVTTQ